MVCRPILPQGATVLPGKLCRMAYQIQVLQMGPIAITLRKPRVMEPGTIATDF